MIVELAVAGVVAPGGNWWTEDVATVATAVQVLNDQAEQAKPRGR